MDVGVSQVVVIFDREIEGDYRSFAVVARSGLGLNVHLRRLANCARFAIGNDLEVDAVIVGGAPADFKASDGDHGVHVCDAKLLLLVVPMHGPTPLTYYDRGCCLASASFWKRNGG